MHQSAVEFDRAQAGWRDDYRRVVVHFDLRRWNVHGPSRAEMKRGFKIAMACDFPAVVQPGSR